MLNRYNKNNKISGTNISRQLKTILHTQKGFSLVEVLVAVALLSICMVGLFSLLVPSTKLLLNTNLKETARNLATAQLEYIKNAEYDKTDDPPNYTDDLVDLSSEYPGFIVGIDAERVHAIGSTVTDDEGVQKITITVSKGGNTITTLEGYKADW